VAIRVGAVLVFPGDFWVAGEEREPGVKKVEKSLGDFGPLWSYIDI
jgi:hypothetical protein